MRLYESNNTDYCYDRRILLNGTLDWASVRSFHRRAYLVALVVPASLLTATATAAIATSFTVINASRIVLTAFDLITPAFAERLYLRFSQGLPSELQYPRPDVRVIGS